MTTLPTGVLAREDRRGIRIRTRKTQANVIQFWPTSEMLRQCANTPERGIRKG